MEKPQVRSGNRAVTPVTPLRRPARPLPVPCRDPDCDHWPCETWREGYDTGFEEGVAAGFAAGQAAGCSCGG